MRSTAEFNKVLTTIKCLTSRIALTLSATKKRVKKTSRETALNRRPPESKSSLVLSALKRKRKEKKYIEE